MVNLHTNRHHSPFSYRTPNCFCLSDHPLLLHAASSPPPHLPALGFPWLQEEVSMEYIAAAVEYINYKQRNRQTSDHTGQSNIHE